MKLGLRALTVTMTFAISSYLAGTGSTQASPAAVIPENPLVTTSKQINDGKSNTEVRPVAAGAKARPYDINGDGYGDTVVGAPGENLGSRIDAGIFHVFYGASTGLSGAGSQAVHQDTPGVPGTAESGDEFGFTDTSGDFNADGYADLAVSADAEDLGSATNAGMVLVFYGSATGLGTDTVVSLVMPRTGLYFGYTLAAGDFTNDGYDDLVASGPWHGSGSVFVFNGGATGIATTGQEFAQGAAVPGSPDQGDGFGSDVAVGDVNGDGYADLAIGAIWDWEDLGRPIGSTTVLYGHPSGLNHLQDGQRFTKETPGVPGVAGRFNRDTGDDPDGFGWQVALSDFNGDSRADLAVGAAGSPVSAGGVRKRDAGTVTVLYSDGTRIGVTNAVELSQQSSGIPGTAESEDYFGATLAADDATGDTRAELAIYTYGDMSVTVIPGGLGGLDYPATTAWTQESYGIPGSTETGDYWGDLLRFEDVKGTGLRSLIVGAPGENNARGAITVIHSTATGLTGTGARALSQDSDGVTGSAEADDWFGYFAV